MTDTPHTVNSKLDLSAEAARAAKVDPETLVLRANPRGVVRFKRELLIGIAAIVCVAIFGATWVALGEDGLKPSQTSENDYDVDHKPTADDLASLPSSYDKIRHLGPPLPGDLGPSVVAREESLGVSPTDANIRPNPEDEAARAERMRLAQQATQAREAGVFFAVSKIMEQAPAADATNVPENGTGASQSVATSIADKSDDRLNLDPARDQNDQQRKLDFLGSRTDRDIYNPHVLQEPVSPYEILAGSIISASLTTGLDSDLPGLVIAQVTENVFDSVSGRVLLIPQGSRLIGTYDSVVAFGQKRALVVWKRIIMPDGSSILIDNLPATDAAGYSGLQDEVDFHTWQLLEGVGLSTLLGVGSQLTISGQSDLVNAIRLSTEDSVNQAGQQITQKNLEVQPTLKVRPGWPLRVIVSKDLVLRPYQD